MLHSPIQRHRAKCHRHGVCGGRNAGGVEPLGGRKVCGQPLSGNTASPCCWEERTEKETDPPREGHGKGSQASYLISRAMCGSFSAGTMGGRRSTRP